MAILEFKEAAQKMIKEQAPYLLALHRLVLENGRLADALLAALSYGFILGSLERYIEDDDRLQFWREALDDLEGI